MEAKLETKKHEKNGMYFIAPLDTAEDFKQLFTRLAREGAGRPVSVSGGPDGPWTPEGLADAISAMEESSKGIEIRAVQIWFQDNENGISNQNLRYLARIFGCDDPIATAGWQKQLLASRARLAEKRRAKKRKSNDLRSSEASLQKDNKPSSQAPVASQLISAQIEEAAQRPTEVEGLPIITRFSEKLLHGSNAFNLLVPLWGAYTFLGLATVMTGAHDVVYSPVEGISKQVGFLWAPHWTVLQLVVLPLFLFTLHGLLDWWKHQARKALSSSQKKATSWAEKIGSLWMAFGSIALICVFFVFLFQWAGGFMRFILPGDATGFGADWNVLSAIRPDLVSSRTSAIMSMMGLAFTSVYVWIFLAGMLLMLAVVEDYGDLAVNIEIENLQIVEDTGLRLVWYVIALGVLGIWLGILNRLHIIYLLTDAPNILVWLLNDLLLFIGEGNEAFNWLNVRHLGVFTTVLMLVVALVACGLCAAVLNKTLKRAGGRLSSSADLSRGFFVIGLLAVTHLSIGQFTGFSVLLLASFAVSAAALMQAFTITTEGHFAAETNQ